MLILEDIESAIPLVQELEDRKMRLSAKIGPLALLASELSVAVASCGSMAAMQAEGYRDNLAQIVSLIHESSASVHRTEHGSILDTSKHDVKLDEFADLVSAGVLATVNRAKQVAYPLISRLQNAISEKMVEYQDRSVFNIGIDEIGIDAVLDNEDVFNYFSEYKDIRHVNIGSVNVFPVLTDIQLAALVEAGSPDINEYLTAALVKVASTDSLGQYVYNYLYRGDRLTNDEVRLFELRNMIGIMYGDASVLEGLMLAYYFGNGLVQNLPDGVNASISEVEHRVALMTKFLGNMIYNHIKNYREQAGERQLLPVGLPYVDRTTGRVNTAVNIRVNKEVYARFLADGGTPEVLFGAMVSDRNTNVDTLLADRAKYENAYARFVDLNRSYTTSSRLSLYEEAIRDEVYKAFDDTEELKAVDKTSGVFVRLADMLKRMGADHISTEENTYKFLRSLVCCVIYPDQPHVEKVISDIDNFECRDGEENLTTSEIACFVLIDLIVDWLSDQIVVSAV